MNTTQYRALLMDNDDMDYTVALRINAISITRALTIATIQCENDWQNMRVVSVEEVNALPL